MIDEDRAAADGIRRIAVIDVGSNSARMVVFQAHPEGSLHVLEDDREPLRLARALRDSPVLGNNAIERTIDALADFHAVARGADVDRTFAVGTAALRDADDARTLVELARERLGVELEVIDGEREAAFGFLGAVHDLPVQHGLVMDVGGGSMELAAFRERRYARGWSLPLGSLRLSDRFLETDPPTERETRKLRDEVHRRLEGAGVPALEPDERLVGIGGTIRNLARVEQRRTRYPLSLLHGYVVPFDRVATVAASIVGRSARQRRRIRGLNPDRADSIAGGALAILATMEALGAQDLMISSRGLREGVALGATVEQVPSPRRVRTVSVAMLGARFATFDRATATRRSLIAARLQEALQPEARPQLQEMLEHAATLLDVGRAIDYYERFEHAAAVATTGDLAGFSHEDLGILSAILRQADEDESPGPYRGLVPAEDRRPLRRAAAILALADEINRRIPSRRPAILSCTWRRGGFLLAGPFPPGWRPRRIGQRFGKVFGRPLVVMAHPSGSALGPAPERR